MSSMRNTAPALLWRGLLSQMLGDIDELGQGVELKMSSKRNNRKHGTYSMPITISTTHHEQLLQLKRRGVNISGWVDRAIELTLKHGTNYSQEEWKRDPDAYVEAAKSVIELVEGIEFAKFCLRRAWVVGKDHGWVVVNPKAGLFAQKWHVQEE